VVAGVASLIWPADPPAERLPVPETAGAPVHV
jgi:hypothetical protein